MGKFWWADNRIVLHETGHLRDVVNIVEFRDLDVFQTFPDKNSVILIYGLNYWPSNLIVWLQ